MSGQASDPYCRIGFGWRLVVGLIDGINTITYRYTHRT